MAKIKEVAEWFNRGFFHYDAAYVPKKEFHVHS
jgi:hypothetical protein